MNPPKDMKPKGHSTLDKSKSPVMKRGASNSNLTVGGSASSAKPKSPVLSRGASNSNLTVGGSVSSAKPKSPVLSRGASNSNLTVGGSVSSAKPKSPVLSRGASNSNLTVGGSAFSAKPKSPVLSRGASNSNLTVGGSAFSAKPKSPVLSRGASNSNLTLGGSVSTSQSEITKEMIEKAYYRWAAKAYKEIEQKEKLEKLKELENQSREIKERIERRNKVIERIGSCNRLQQLLSSLKNKSSLSDAELNNLFSKLQELTNSTSTQRIELKNICQLTDNEEFKKTLKEFVITVNVTHAHLEMMETVDKLTQEYQLRLAEHNNFKQKLMAKMDLAESLLLQYNLHQPKNEREVNERSQDNILDDYKSHNKTEDDNGSLTVF